MNAKIAQNFILLFIDMRKDILTGRNEQSPGCV